MRSCMGGTIHTSIIILKVDIANRQRKERDTKYLMVMGEVKALCLSLSIMSSENIHF